MSKSEEKKSVAELIIALEEKALERWTNGDPDGYLELYAEDITYFDTSLDQKLEGLTAMKNYYEPARGKQCAEHFEMIRPVVQHSGSMAVLAYNFTCRVKGKTSRWNCTEVYRLEKDNKWKIIHNHWSPLKG